MKLLENTVKDQPWAKAHEYLYEWAKDGDYEEVNYVMNPCARIFRDNVVHELISHCHEKC